MPLPEGPDSKRHSFSLWCRHQEGHDLVSVHPQHGFPGGTRCRSCKDAAYPADGVGSSSDRCPQSPGSRLPGLATSRLHGTPAIPITEPDNHFRGIPGERTSNPQQNSSNLLFPLHSPSSLSLLPGLVLAASCSRVLSSPFLQ